MQSFHCNANWSTAQLGSAGPAAFIVRQGRRVKLDSVWSVAESWIFWVDLFYMQITQIIGLSINEKYII